jgi:hypothetical protein
MAAALCGARRQWLGVFRELPLRMRPGRQGRRIELGQSLMRPRMGACSNSPKPAPTGMLQ